MNNVHYSSLNHKWETPANLVKDLGNVFKWDMDVCASRDNVCANFWNEQQNGLAKSWHSSHLRWMNPPYGNQINLWMNRAWMNKEKGATVCLVPARTDTTWWQAYVPGASLVCFIRGRLTFGSDDYWQLLWESEFKTDTNGNPLTDKEKRPVKNVYYQQHGRKDSAPFPSAFIVFGNISYEQRQVLAGYGWTPDIR